jgi:hypothetical protein
LISKNTDALPDIPVYVIVIGDAFAFIIVIKNKAS